ncbi:hypothetical protein Sfum_2501 [Syntrophobacter fumaroxidans MPOB]|uniref:Uncharacterized protein n=2 Tax=Syntrophobacter TaxID=29526 RepID=A0LL78_SYNFM|nr:hypothetical protein Sfum_2501 [Syntrophobacter fumaroxidans MPOB]
MEVLYGTLTERASGCPIPEPVRCNPAKRPLHATEISLSEVGQIRSVSLRGLASRDRVVPDRREPAMNANELRQSFAEGLEALSDRQVFFLAMLLTSLNEAIRATVESGMAEIRAELAELRRTTGGSR